MGMILGILTNYETGFLGEYILSFIIKLVLFIEDILSRLFIISSIISAILLFCIIISLFVASVWNLVTMRKGTSFKTCLLPSFVFILFVTYGMIFTCSIVDQINRMSRIDEPVPLSFNYDNRRLLLYNSFDNKGTLIYNDGHRTSPIIKDIDSVNIVGNYFYFRQDSICRIALDKKTAAKIEEDLYQAQIDTCKELGYIELRLYAVAANMETISAEECPKLYGNRQFYYRQFFKLAGRWELSSLVILCVIGGIIARNIYRRNKPYHNTKLLG